MSEDRNRNPGQEDRSRQPSTDGRRRGGESSSAQQQRDSQGQFSGRPQDRTGQRDLRDTGQQRRDSDERQGRR